VTFDWSSGALAAGLACYQDQQFFRAHEHWESVWIGSSGQEKLFLQALIQIAVAMHHRLSGNRAGAVALLGRALQRLENCPPAFCGIAVAPLRTEAAAWRSALESGAACADREAPRIQPL
jgi:predicted metal-dependent hydrolase